MEVSLGAQVSIIGANQWGVYRSTCILISSSGVVVWGGGFVCWGRPRRWIEGRFLIVAVNLGENVIGIEEGIIHTLTINKSLLIITRTSKS